MKVYKVDFTPVWPVPSGLIINAKNIREAKKIAKETIKHTTDFEVREINIKESGVVFYESGEY